MTVTVTWPDAAYTSSRWRCQPVPETANVTPFATPALRDPTSTPAASVTPYRPPSTRRPAEYRIRIHEIDADGYWTCLDELGGDALDLTWERNNAGSAKIRCRPTDNGARYLFDRTATQTKLRDEALLVQVWRQNRPIWVGRPDTPAYDPATGWYTADLVEHGATELDDATLGDAERDNHARNGDFASGFDWWPGLVSVTRSIETKRGRRAVKLVGTASASYMYAIHPIPATGSYGNSITVSAWYCVDASDSLPAFGQGMQVWKFEDGVFVGELPGPTIEVRGQWVRVTTSTNQRPDVRTEIQTNLWAPNGSPIWWRKVQVVRPDSTSVTPGRDIGQYAAELVRATSAAQRYQWGRRVTLPIYELRNGKAARHDRHPSALDELHDCEPWLDWHFEHASHRSVRFRAYPTKTTPRTDLVLTPDTCDGLRYAQDGPAVSRVITLGDAGDYARDEGQSIDSGAFGGRLRDLVEPAPPQTDPDDLDAVSARRLAQVSRSPARFDADVSSSLSSPVHVSGEWVHYIRPGDVLKCQVPVDVVEIGRVTITSMQRITSMRLDPLSDRLTLTLEGVGADAEP